MATNFNKGFTNVANSSELPSSDWIKKEWDCANQIFFDDFDTLHANRYQVKQSGGGTGAIVNGEKDGVLRLTTGSGASNYTALYFAGDTGSATAPFGALSSGADPLNAPDEETDLFVKVRLKLHNDDSATKALVVFGLIDPAANSPFLHFGTQAIMAAGKTDTGFVLGNPGISGRITTSADETIPPYMGTAPGTIGDGEYHTLALAYKRAPHGKGNCTHQQGSSGGARILQFYYDNQVMQAGAETSAGRHVYAGGYISSFMKWNNSSTFPLVSPSTGGLSLVVGALNNTVGAAYSLDIDYVMVSAEKPKGSL